MTLLWAILTAVDSPIRAAAGSEYVTLTTYGGTR
jgi:hypothetical protein